MDGCCTGEQHAEVVSFLMPRCELSHFFAHSTRRIVFFLADDCRVFHFSSADIIDAFDLFAGRYLGRYGC